MQNSRERLHRLQADFCSWVSPCRFFWEFAGASDPWNFPEFGDSYTWLKASETLVCDDYMGIGYPLF